MWGFENWGELICGSEASPVPLTSPLGLILLTALLLLGAVYTLRRRHWTLAMTLSAIVLAIPLAAYAGSVVLPNVFTNGTTANAPEVNANFDALVAGVNDNDARIDALSSLFGVNTSMASAGTGAQCTLGAVWLTAGIIASGVPAEGQLLGIAENMSLFSLLGPTYGGNSPTSFALPDLRDAAPNGLTYVICTAGAFPQS